MTPGPRDETTPGDRWEFNEEVTDAFDDMLARSIPQHDVMREAVLELGSRFVRPGSTIVDLGCSRGEALAPFVTKFGTACSYLGVEVSAPMRAAAERRFSEYVDPFIKIKVEDLDLRESYPAPSACLTLAVLTVQFVPIEHRLRLLRDAYRHTERGGALILVEKVLGADADIDAAMVALYYDHKRRAGYTAEQIDRKRLSLEGVLVPVTAHMNEELLAAAGFRHVDTFWRWMNFAGWVAVKED